MDPSQILNQILAAAGISASQLPADVDFSPGNILRSILILIATYIAARIVRRLLTHALEPAKMDPRAKTVLLQITFYGIIALGVVWVLGGFGLSIVLLGVVFGFALKDLIQNFAAGMLIMGTRPFQAGDWVMIGPSEGIVKEVGWRGTFLNTFDGRVMIVPNASILTNVVVNNSLTSQLRSTLTVSVALESDFTRIEQWILDSLKPIEGISSNPPPRVLIENLTGNAINLSIQFWVADPINQQRLVVSRAFQTILATLSAHEVVIQPIAAVVPPREVKAQ
ncbi:MAG: mechanosensitive ion channel family protein [Chloroflexota bacterium]|nr:MAG: mechanosensitive ion channel family protein [Chloroflexota bacterium]